MRKINMKNENIRHIFWGKLDSQEFKDWLEQMIEIYGKDTSLKFIIEKNETRIKDEIDIKTSEQLKLNFEKDE